VTGEEERCPFPPSCPLELLPFRWLQCWLRRSASTSVITITIYSGFLVVRAGGEIGDVALPMLQLVDLKKERERKSGIMICFLLAFNGLQSQDSGTFQMFISMQRKLLGYSVWITGGRKICLIDLIFLTSGAFEAAIFP